MGRRYTGRKTVLWRKSARASSLCQEAGAAAMAELGGSVQLDYWDSVPVTLTRNTSSILSMVVC